MINYSEIILRAVDEDGSSIQIHRSSLSTWGWQYFNPKRRELDFGWACSLAEAVEKSQRLLKPDADGKYPAFKIVEPK